MPSTGDANRSNSSTNPTQTPDRSAQPGVAPLAGSEKYVPPNTVEVDGVEGEAPPYGTGPVGTGDYRVGDGECMNSIAIKTGFFWETLWNRPENGELNATRKDPSVLLPSDRVFIPEKRRKEEAGQTEAVHRFRRKGRPSKLSIVFNELDKPRANENYVLNVDGKIQTGILDGEGRLDVYIPPGAREATILLGDGHDEHHLQLGGTHPITEVSGLQQRLNNLGFGCGEVDNALTPRTRAALKRFQLANGMDGTGLPDEATVQRLKSAHGS